MMKNLLPILSIVVFSAAMMPQEFNTYSELEDSQKSKSIAVAAQHSYTINDTGQTKYYDNDGEISAPKSGQSFYGQDAHYTGKQMSFRDNDDGTVTDLNTGLVWQKSPPSGRYQWTDAMDYADNLKLAGQSDWRLPSIKELVSIVGFSGSMTSETPYIDTDYFDFEYPDGSDGARDMDAQYWSSNKYLGIVMRGDTRIVGSDFEAGSKITLKAKVTNAGSSKSLATTVNWYLSPKKQVTNKAILLGSKNLKSLLDGKSKWVKLRTKLPSDATGGVKYIVTSVDETDLNDDQDTANNSATDRILIY